MAKFKKGQSGNPSGRPKLPADVLAAKKITSNGVVLSFSRLMFMTDGEINALLNDPKTPKWDRVIARILEKADHYGCATRAEFLLSRTIGKVTDKLEVALPVPTVIERPNGTRVELGAKIENDNEEDTE